MKVVHPDSRIKGSHGLTESKAYTIRTTAHAFQMLSTGLYSDKPAAVLREIGCNAMDAHIEQGTPDRPIEVKLPNRVDNQFYVKDWGPGLSHDDVMGLYTTYFASTKQESNAYTGAFGLGSKSPFSYTDSYVVTSVHGGKKRTYSLHLGADGSPTIALLTTEAPDADWEHGIMVGFPVKPNDYLAFQTKAQEIYQWFRVKPRVLGATAIRPMEWDVDLPEFGKVRSYPGTFVLMGNVSYAVEANSIANLTPLAQYAFRFGGVVLKVPIGEVQVVASRERLQYDPRGTAVLMRRLEYVSKHAATELAAHARRFEGADWAGKCAMKLASNVWSAAGSGRYVNWAELFDAAGDQDAAKLAEWLAAYHVPLPNYAGASSSFRVLELGSKKVLHTPVTDGKAGGKDNVRDAFLELKASTALYYGNAPHPLARARKAVLESKHAQLILVTPNVTKDPTRLKYEAEAKKVAKELGLKDVFDVATLDLPPNFAAKGTGKGRSKKAKGATMPPMPSKPVLYLAAVDRFTQQLPTIDISKVTRPDDQHFMCQLPKWQYNHDRGIRVFADTADKDRAFSADRWGQIWRDFTELQKEVNVAHTSSFVLVPAATIRELDLLKRGWKTSHAVVEEWLKEPTNRALIAQQAGKWRPTVTISHHARDWVGYFVWLQQADPVKFATATPVLRAAGILDALVDVFNASKAAKGKAGQNTPAVVTLFDRLRMSYPDVPPIPHVGIRTYLSAADLEAQIKNRFKLMNKVFESDELRRIYDNGSSAQVQEFLKLLFT